MNPQIMSKLQAKLDADKAAYFAAGGTVTVYETTPPKLKDTWEHYVKPEEKLPEIDTTTAGEILGFSRSFMSKLASAHKRNGSPCPEYRMEGQTRIWNRTSVEAFQIKRKRRHDL